MSWIRDNVATVAGWLGVVLSVIVLGTTWVNNSAARDVSQDQAIERVDSRLTVTESDVQELKSDTRSLAERQARIDQVVTRQEQTTRQLETVTAELRAVVSTLKE